MKKIMVCYDFSDNSEKALEVAVTWANKFGSTVDLVYVDDQLVHAGLYADINVPGFEENAYKYRNEVFNDKVSKLRDKHCEGDLSIRGHLLFGNPVSELLEFSKNNGINMIIMGSKGVNIFSKFSLGSLAWSLISTTHLPLLCVKQDMVNEPKRIMYAAELSKDETRTLEVLKGITDVFSPHLEVGHIIGPDTTLASDHEITSDELYDRLEKKIDLAHQRALFKIDSLIKKWNFKDASTFVDNVIHENTAKRLLKHVEKKEVDLFILGSHAKSFWNKIVMGSVSDYVLRRSTKSFLIIPNEDKE